MEISTNIREAVAQKRHASINVLYKSTFTLFLPRDAMHKHGVCRHAVSVCVCVCLCVCLSVTFVNSVETNRIVRLFHRRVDPLF